MKSILKKIRILPKYSSTGPSSRYRIYSYLPFYEKAGVDFDVLPLLGEWYLKRKWSHKSTKSLIPKIISAYLMRVISVLTLKKNSIVYIGADSLPGIPPIIEWILNIRKIPYLIEFDDAVFHNYDNNKLLHNKYHYIISHAAHVITGSQYLSDYVKKWNNNVTEIPTSIDYDSYSQARHSNIEGIPIIGWIGSTLSSGYLLPILPALRRLAKIREFKLNLIGFDKTLEQELFGINYEIIQWSAGTEIKEMEKFTVGIMPLNDSPFERGKCAFKLVQYMAVGIPTISTPLQSNININKNSKNLFADTEDEWYDGLLNILDNPERFSQVGKKNREIALAEYTFQNNWRKYIEVFSKL